MLFKQLFIITKLLIIVILRPLIPETEIVLNPRFLEEINAFREADSRGKTTLLVFRISPLLGIFTDYLLTAHCGIRVSATVPPGATIATIATIASRYGIAFTDYCPCCLQCFDDTIALCRLEYPPRAT